MAHRKQKPLIDPGIALGLLISIGVIWLILQNLQISLVILMCGAAALGFAQPASEVQLKLAAQKSRPLRHIT
jgi:hypothetical protein